MRIRPARPATDRDFVERLNTRLAEPIKAPAHDAAQVTEFQRRFTATAWDEHGGATFIVESEAGEALGYINLRGGNDDIAGQPCAYIALLAVTPEAEGSGAAAALLEQGAAWAREQGYSLMSLDVFASNARARGFYQKAGFAEETVRLVRRLD